jgi:2-amino-4-hydroxy-6-hydroxymethyldihydropteridine diphosphokinase
MAQNVYIGSGSNLGDRFAYLKSAAAELLPVVRIIKASAVYETPPWGFEIQPAFLNQVLQTETDLLPHELLVYLKGIEQKMGRKANFLYGPRSIDLDILFYDGLIHFSEDLQIPHPMIIQRAFVLVPFCEIAPDFIHPLMGRSIAELVKRVDGSAIKVYEESADGKK